MKSRVCCNEFELFHLAVLKDLKLRRNMRKTAFQKAFLAAVYWMDEQGGNPARKQASKY